MKQFLFVTGMFRSGTTLLARLLHMHPDIAFASDTYQPILKAFRNQVARTVDSGLAADAAAPFDDYYFHADKQAVMTAIRETPLATDATCIDIESLRRDIATYCNQFSPRLPEHLDAVAGDNYADLMRGGFEAVDRAYGNGAAGTVGFKITWTGEFVPHVLEAFDNAKAIHIVRDPRAVCASKKMSEVQYPWLFLTRQWRKLATLAWLDDNGEAYSDRVLVVRYESLVKEPEAQIGRICDFLGVPVDPAMMAPGRFDDGSGEAWRGNSSHFQEVKTFNVASLDRWRETLTEDEVVHIEQLCRPEMRLYDYAPASAPHDVVSDRMLLDPPRVPLDRLADWIRARDFDARAMLAEMALEAWRIDKLAGGQNGTDDLKRRCALDARAFDALIAR